MFYCGAKHSDIYEVLVIFIVICFWVVMVKKGCGILDQGTLKSAMTQESFDEIS